VLRILLQSAARCAESASQRINKKYTTATTEMIEPTLEITFQ